MSRVLVVDDLALAQEIRERELSKLSRAAS